MKHIKTFAVIALFFAVNIMSAQAQPTTIKSWPELNSVQEVTNRINMNIENNNPNGAFFFTETLMQVTQKLANTPIPAEFKNPANSKTVKDMATKAEELNKQSLSKAPQETLKKSFAEFKASLETITSKSAKK